MRTLLQLGILGRLQAVPAFCSCLWFRFQREEKSVAVQDDVMTTSAALEKISRAATISAWVMARTAKEA